MDTQPRKPRIAEFARRQLSSGFGMFLGMLALASAGQSCLNAAAGDIYVVAGHRDPEDVPLILRYDSNRTRSVFASGGTPYGLAFDRAGNLFVSTATSGSILRYSPDGKSSVFANI